MRSSPGRHSSPRPNVSDARQDGQEGSPHTHTNIPVVVVVVAGLPHPALPRANRCRVHPYFPFLGETWRGTCHHLFLGGGTGQQDMEASQDSGRNEGRSRRRRLSSSSRRPAPPCVAWRASQTKEVRRRRRQLHVHTPSIVYRGLTSWFAGSILTGSRTKGCIWELLALAVCISL